MLQHVLSLLFLSLNLTNTTNTTNHTLPVHNTTNQTLPVHNTTNHTLPVHNTTNHTLPVHNTTNHTLPVHNTTNHTLPVHNHTEVPDHGKANAPAPASTHSPSPSRKENGVIQPKHADFTTFYLIISGMFFAVSLSCLIYAKTKMNYIFFKMEDECEFISVGQEDKNVELSEVILDQSSSSGSSDSSEDED
jgi:hypothetical protein